jgi:hypothetical protein
MPTVLKARDICDNYVIEKDILPNIPYRFILQGSSGQGKSNILSCMCCLPDWYGDNFTGNNIYIWSGSKGDDKISRMCEFKEIPEANIRHEWIDSEVSSVYESLLEDWRDAVADGKKPENILFICDDMFFSNKFRSEAAKDSMMSKVFQNGRKFNISIIILSQKYSSIATSIRENCSAMITFASTNKQMELMETDFNYLPTKQEFYKIFRKATQNKYDFLFININLPIHDRYMDKNFKSIVSEN